ncbi:MAG: efflux RND transporter periplasmic adaptor subunit [Planctomycetes bacterium]|nr:efflux RND transporter periplasmic adaptor subunit [Planctomycetota bacterium]
MKKFAAAAAVAAVVAVLALVYAPKGESGDSGPEMQAAYTEVGVISLKTEDVTITQELNGRVTPFLLAEVRPQVNGIILNRMFDEGSDVEKDMPLYQIDPAIYEAEYNRAMANLNKARANVEVAVAKLARYDRLIEARAVNQQEYDEVEAASRQAEAEVGIAEAEARLAKINLDYATVKSPISGRIGKSWVTQGALVTASQADPLAIVQQLDPVYVDVSQPINWLLMVKRGLDPAVLENTGESHAVVNLLLDTGDRYEHEGHLLFADVTVDQTTGSISIRAEFPNPNHDLLPGMYVRAVIDVAQIKNAVTVPQIALIRNAAGEAFVYVVRDDNSVERRKVNPLRTIDDRWIIGDGLSGDERIVVEGLQRVMFMPNDPNPKINPVAVD